MKHYTSIIHSLFPILVWSSRLCKGGAFLHTTSSTPTRHERRTIILFEQSRRDAFKLGTAGLASINVFLSPLKASSMEESAIRPLADLPMIRLKLPKNGLGREYVVVQLNIDGKGPFDFMVDSGLTTEMITPHLKDILHIATGSSKIRGLAAGGRGRENPIVELKAASLCCGDFRDGTSLLPLASPLRAVVTDFPQEHIDPNHDVEGMLGMELLELFDVDFDFPRNRIRFWPPQKSPKDDLVVIPAAVLNESGLEGIRVRSPQQLNAQPMIGIIDCGASFTTINTAAAQLLGLPRDPQEYNSPSVYGVGVDGRPMVMPTANIEFTFTGKASKDASGALKFEEPPSK